MTEEYMGNDGEKGQDAGESGEEVFGTIIRTAVDLYRLS